MARPACITCKKPTSERGYFERTKMCAPCYRLSLLLPYTDAEAERLVRERYRETSSFDKVLAFMRRTMAPPPSWTDAGWMLHHVVELDSRRFSW